MRTDDKLLIKYYRLSLEDDTDGESGSIGNQRKIVEDYMKADPELAGMQSREYIDDGYTGTNFNRPGIGQVLELLRNNQVACIIVKDFSRFTRDYIELGNYLEQIFPFMEVRFISVTDRYDSNIDVAANGMEVPFKGLLNNLYSQDLSVKMKSAKRQLIKQGKVCSGSYPFGYQKTACGTSLYMIDEPAAETVRLIFQLALAGKTNIEIARELNAEKLLTPAVYKRQHGGTSYGLKEGEVSLWDGAKVLLILRDERYAGTMIAGRYQSAGVGSGKVIEAPKHLWYRKEQAMPAIVSMDEFEMVQKLRPYHKKGEYRKEKHLLYRKVKCGCCGRYLYFKPSESGAQYNSFFCKQSHVDPNSKCFTGYIKEREILDMLLVLLQKQVAVYGDKEQLTIKKKNSDSNRKRLAQLEKDLGLLKVKKVEDYQLYREQVVSKLEFLERKELVRGKMETIEQEIGELTKLVAAEQVVDEQGERICKLGGIERLDRGLIEELVDVVWVFDVGRVKVELNYGV